MYGDAFEFDKACDRSWFDVEDSRLQRVGELDGNQSASYDQLLVFVVQTVDAWWTLYHHVHVAALVQATASHVCETLTQSSSSATCEIDFSRFAEVQVWCVPSRGTGWDHVHSQQTTRSRAQQFQSTSTSTTNTNTNAYSSTSTSNPNANPNGVAPGGASAAGWPNAYAEGSRWPDATLSGFASEAATAADANMAWMYTDPHSPSGSISSGWSSPGLADTFMSADATYGGYLDAYTGFGMNDVELFGAGQAVPFVPTYPQTHGHATGVQEAPQAETARRRRPHVCEICGREVRRPGVLEDHMNSHTGNKPYSCPHCPQTFTTRSNRQRHVVNFHGGRGPR